MNDSESPGFKIREAELPDVPGIASIYNHYVRHGGATFDNQAWSLEQTQHYLTSDDTGVWLAADQAARLIGWASARRFSARYGYRFSLESAVYVDASQTGRGIGLALMECLIDRCFERGIHHLMARIIGGNEASLILHRKLGFDLVGTQKEVGQMNDQWLDVVLMQKIL